MFSKKLALCLTATGLCVLAISSARADTVASIAVTNLSQLPLLTIQCALSSDTDFFQAPRDEHQRVFTIKTSQSLSIDIEKHGVQPDTAPNMKCTELSNPNNWFTYTIIEPYSEKATVHGQFSYDPDYPGSFLFRAPAG